MVKTIHVPLDDKIHEEIKNIKGDMTWEAWFVKLAAEQKTTNQTKVKK
jgi:hypothetical protein